MSTNGNNTLATGTTVAVTVKPMILPEPVKIVAEIIRQFDEFTEVEQHHELRIGVPVGFNRFDEYKDLADRKVEIVLIYTYKKLSFSVSCADSSRSATPKIVRDSYDREKEFTWYSFDTRLCLTIADCRILIAWLNAYFHGWYVDIYTAE